MGALRRRVLVRLHRRGIKQPASPRRSAPRLSASADLEPLHGKEQSVEKNGEIKKDPAILNVIEVVLKGFMDGKAAITAELPKAGQALGNGEPSPFEWGVGVSDIGHLRPRPDE